MRNWKTAKIIQSAHRIYGRMHFAAGNTMQEMVLWRIYAELE